jgi:DNA-binding transcriptional regulator YdaS (Cro superfamily)
MSTKTVDTRGRAELDAFLRDLTNSGGSASDFARLIQSTPQAVSFWRLGDRRPGLASVFRIERATGIRPMDWLTVTEHALVMQIPTGAE